MHIGQSFLWLGSEKMTYAHPIQNIAFPFRHDRPRRIVCGVSALRMGPYSVLFALPVNVSDLGFGGMRHPVGKPEVNSAEIAPEMNKSVHFPNINNLVCAWLGGRGYCLPMNQMTSVDQPRY
jgi:hypothetical protein